jgi:hypothetical protein
MFLLMVFLRYFIDEAKTLHWVEVLEVRLSRAGRVPSLEVALGLIILMGGGLCSTSQFAQRCSFCWPDRPGAADP